MVVRLNLVSAFFSQQRYFRADFVVIGCQVNFSFVSVEGRNNCILAHKEITPLFTVSVVKLSIARVVAKHRLPGKFASWERGHRRLNFGWRTLG